MNGFDWAHIRSFLAVAEHGSLSAAARELQISQPTIGRHVAALEETLSVTLFDPVRDGMRITAQGIKLIEPARDMAAGAAAVSMRASGAQKGIGGTVRITASEVFGALVLPQLLRPILDQAPDLQIELVPTNANENLLLREADIAIRMAEPTQGDLIARKIAELPMGFYVHPDIALPAKGGSFDDILQYDLIGYDKSDLILRGMAEYGYPASRDFFRLRVDDQVAYVNLVRAGLGAGILVKQIAQNAGLVQIAADLELPKMPCFLASHSALKTAPNVRFVFDQLSDSLRAWAKNLDGRAIWLGADK